MNTILQLAKNDIRSRYSNSLLGIVWAFVMPLVTILVFWYVFQRGFKNLPVGDAPYILWFSAAYIPPQPTSRGSSLWMWSRRDAIVWWNTAFS